MHKCTHTYMYVHVCTEFVQEPIHHEHTMYKKKNVRVHVHNNVCVLYITMYFVHTYYKTPPIPIPLQQLFVWSLFSHIYLCMPRPNGKCIYLVQVTINMTSLVKQFSTTKNNWKKKAILIWKTKKEFPNINKTEKYD